jgi:hypothetical protein
VTAQHGRAKTRNGVLCREKGSILVIGPLTLGVLPRRELRTETRICCTCHHGDEEQHAQTNTKEEKGRSTLHYRQTPSSRTPTTAFALTAFWRISSSVTAGKAPFREFVISYTIVLTGVNENVGRSWRRRDDVV